MSLNFKIEFTNPEIERKAMEIMREAEALESRRGELVEGFIRSPRGQEIERLKKQEDEKRKEYDEFAADALEAGNAKVVIQREKKIVSIN